MREWVAAGGRGVGRGYVWVQMALSSKTRGQPTCRHPGCPRSCGTRHPAARECRSRRQPQVGAGRRASSHRRRQDSSGHMPSVPISIQMSTIVKRVHPPHGRDENLVRACQAGVVGLGITVPSCDILIGGGASTRALSRISCVHVDDVLALRRVRLGTPPGDGEICRALCSPDGRSR